MARQQEGASRQQNGSARCFASCTTVSPMLASAAPSSGSLLVSHRLAWTNKGAGQGFRGPGTQGVEQLLQSAHV